MSPRLSLGRSIVENHRSIMMNVEFSNSMGKRRKTMRKRLNGTQKVIVGLSKAEIVAIVSKTIGFLINLEIVFNITMENQSGSALAVDVNSHHILVLKIGSKSNHKHLSSFSRRMTVVTTMGRVFMQKMIGIIAVGITRI